MNYNAKGKGLIFGEKAKKRTFTAYSWEVEKIKNFLKIIRAIKKAEIKEKLNFICICILMSGGESMINNIFNFLGG